MNTVGSDKRLNYYRLSPEEVITELHSHKMGLTHADAERRFHEYGPNDLSRTSRTPTLFIFLRQFRNIFVGVLLLSAACAYYLQDGRTASLLIAIALLNTLVGFFQEYKAESLLSSLEQLLLPHAKVIRNGTLEEIDSTHVVLGDIVYIEEGDAIPADLRILDEDELTTNDFALTGESNPTRKFVHAINAPVPLAARHNLTFMGTTAASGSAHGVVIATGMHTELGRIASLSQVTQTDDSPLQREMNNLAKRLAQGTLILASALVIFALQANMGLKAALLFAIGICAAMVPNGLAAEINITLAQTAARMAKARALIRRLSAVETLGATDIILTDKTGTLTQNVMSVTHMLIGRTTYHTKNTGYRPKGAVLDSNAKKLGIGELHQISLFFVASALASNSRVCPPDARHSDWYVLGDPTEGALITMARKGGINTESLEIQYPELKEFQFDAGRKLMSSVRSYNDEVIVFVKGAPESVLERCKRLWDHGHVRNFTKGDESFFMHHLEQEAKSAMRNLAIAYKVLPKGTDPVTVGMDKIEKDLTFLGIVSMQDPLRNDAASAMRAAQLAHAHVSIATGDYPTTAHAIAEQAHLATDHGDTNVVVADELATLSDVQVLRLLEQGGTVFSRVSPEDKLRLVEIAKSAGHVVAVTGDGINDAPALKRADIGVAMGATGTDIAKNAAEIILLDDSFGTLIGAIEQGRLTFANIRKAARCALTDNAGELITILFSLGGQALFHVPLAITAIQILAIDIIAQMLPIASLGWDKATTNLMHDHPRRLNDHIMNGQAVREFILFGILAGSIAYCNFLFFFARQGLSASYIDPTSTLYAQASTLTYLTLVLCQFANLLLVRADTHEKFFSSYLLSNKRLLASFAVSLFCVVNLIYTPLLQPYFGTGKLGLADWLTATGGAAIYLGVRIIQRHTRKHAHHAVVRLHHEIFGKNSPVRI